MTLRLAGLLDGSVDTDGLATALADRAHFSDAVDLVGELTDRGLLADGRPTAAGRDLTTATLTTITTDTAPIWDNLSGNDVAATTRVLNEVITRARNLLG